MAEKKAIQNRIRGWFPQEPHYKGNQKTKFTTLKSSPTIQERLVWGLGAAGGTLTVTGIMFSFVPSYPQTLAVAVLIIGISLLMTTFFIRRIYKK